MSPDECGGEENDGDTKSKMSLNTLQLKSSTRAQFKHTKRAVVRRQTMRSPTQLETSTEREILNQQIGCRARRENCRFYKPRPTLGANVVVVLDGFPNNARRRILFEGLFQTSG